MLIYFESYVGVTPNVVQLLAKWVRMHVYYSIMVDKVHWYDLWISVCIQRSYSSNWLAVKKLHHFML